MGTPTVTPNIGLQVSAFAQANWQVPTNFNWNLIDNMCGGLVTIPSLVVETLTIGNLPTLVAGIQMQETPAGTVPGTVYTLSKSPTAMLSFYVNGVFQRPSIEYTVSGTTVTLATATASGDTVYATYFN